MWCPKSYLLPSLTVQLPCHKCKYELDDLKSNHRPEHSLAQSNPGHIPSCLCQFLKRPLFSVQRRVAFSRIDRDRKEYVQDLIEQDCAQVYDLISNHQAHIYICGKVIVLSNLVISNFLDTTKLFLIKSNVPYCQLFTSEINISLF